MTPTITEPSPSPEIKLGACSPYERLKEIFRQLAAIDSEDLRYILLSTPWVHFLQYLECNTDRVRLTSSRYFKTSCVSNPYTPRQETRAFFSRYLTDKKLTVDSHKFSVESTLSPENPHIRLIWLSVKHTLRDKPLTTIYKILSLGNIPEDVLLDIYEFLPASDRPELVTFAVRHTGNIPAVFLSQLDYVELYYLKHTHLEGSLELLSKLTTKNIAKKYWYLARADKVCIHVAQTINEYYSSKLPEVIGPTTGGSTNSSGPDFSVGKSLSANLPELSTVSN